MRAAGGCAVRVVAGDALGDAAADRVYWLGAIAYQAALVDRLCERTAQARRLKRRAEVARRITDLKWAVRCWFEAQDERLRAEYGVRS